jgi:hypothetical protein
MILVESGADAGKVFHTPEAAEIYASKLHKQGDRVILSELAVVKTYSYSPVDNAHQTTLFSIIDQPFK